MVRSLNIQVSWRKLQAMTGSVPLRVPRFASSCMLCCAVTCQGAVAESIALCTLHIILTGSCCACCAVLWQVEELEHMAEEAQQHQVALDKLAIQVRTIRLELVQV